MVVRIQGFLLYAERSKLSFHNNRAATIVCAPPSQLVMLSRFTKLFLFVVLGLVRLHIILSRH